MKVVLTVAGCDPSGGAGVTTDLRTLSALGVTPTLAVTAITVQTPREVRQVVPVAPELVAAQIQAALETAPPDAVKVGLLPRPEVVEAVAAALAETRVPLVLDPVLAASSGPTLVADGVVDALRGLLSRVDLILPNLPELEALAGPLAGPTDRHLAEAAGRRRAHGAGAVWVKGGHRRGDADDLLVDAEGTLSLPGERIPGADPRGTGCALSSAVAAWLARGRTLREAAPLARRFVRSAIEQALDVGDPPPLHLFHEFYGREGLP